MSRNYSGSAPVEWLRKKVFKIEKPRALGWGQWTKWDNELKKKRPIAFFFTEVLPEWIEWIPAHSVDYYNEVRYFIANYRGNTHGLQSTLKKGKWHEFEERLLYSVFDSFIDFIEIEGAGHHIAWSKKVDRDKYNVKWWHRFWFLRWDRSQRYPQAGIDHLLWEMTLDTPPDPPDPNWSPCPSQAAHAREVMTLHTWWKVIRTARVEPWEASGLRTFWTEMDTKYGEDGNWLGLGSRGKMTRAERAEYDRLSNANDNLEEQWHEEDDAMLIRLIRIRRGLWT